MDSNYSIKHGQKSKYYVSDSKNSNLIKKKLRIYEDMGHEWFIWIIRTNERHVDRYSFDKKSTVC